MPTFRPSTADSESTSCTTRSTSTVTTPCPIQHLQSIRIMRPLRRDRTRPLPPGCVRFCRRPDGPNWLWRSTSWATQNDGLRTRAALPRPSRHIHRPGTTDRHGVEHELRRPCADRLPVPDHHVGHGRRGWCRTRHILADGDLTVTTIDGERRRTRLLRYRPSATFATPPGHPPPQRPGGQAQPRRRAFHWSFNITPPAAWRRGGCGRTDRRATIPVSESAPSSSRQETFAGIASSVAPRRRCQVAVPPMYRADGRPARGACRGALVDGGRRAVTCEPLCVVLC